MHIEGVHALRSSRTCLTCCRQGQTTHTFPSNALSSVPRHEPNQAVHTVVLCVEHAKVGSDAVQVDSQETEGVNSTAREEQGATVSASVLQDGDESC